MKNYHYWRVTYIFPSNKEKGRVNDSHIVPYDVAKTEEEAEMFFKQLRTFNGSGSNKEVAEIIKIEEINNKKMNNLKDVNEFFNFGKKEVKDEVMNMIGKSLSGLKNTPMVHDFILNKRDEDYVIRLILNKDDEFGDTATMLYILKPSGQYEYELSSFGSKTLNPSSNIINVSDIETNLLPMIQNDVEAVSLEEDAGAGGGGAATAGAGTTSGMGNVASAQPASTPGATVTGDGTTGSGDYGNPLFPTAKKDGSSTLGKKKGKKKDKKKESVIANFIAQHKAGKTKKGATTSKDGSTSSKMLNFNDFVNNDIEK